jgi:hypothetical protein
MLRIYGHALMGHALMGHRVAIQVVTVRYIFSQNYFSAAKEWEHGDSES